MADIRIHRDHDLGLARARELAWKWAEEVEQKFDMACTVVEGEFGDTVEFTRSGVKGRLIVAADHFDLEAKLGFLLGAFARTIEGEIEKNLDKLLGAAALKGAGAPSAARPATPTAATAAPAREPRKAAAKAAAKDVARPVTQAAATRPARPPKPKPKP